MLNIGDKKYRNLQEQVGYNTECIKKLAEAIDGITIEDKLVVIETDSGTFTDEELVILSGPLAFISNGSRVWMKDSETLVQFVYKAIDIVATEVGGTYFNVGGSKIVVNRETGAYNTSSDTIITTYNKTQIDSLLALKANSSDVYTKAQTYNQTQVDNLLALKANLSGANFTGNVIMGSGTELQGFENITDKDNHKRFVEGNITLPSISGVTFTYGKWSLSGTHLMIVVAGEAESGVTFAGYASLLNVSLPAWILNKIYPTFSKFIEIKEFDFYNADWTKETSPMKVALSKETTVLGVSNFGGPYTTTKDRGFRFAFDLLIDDE